MHRSVAPSPPPSEVKLTVEAQVRNGGAFSCPFANLGDGVVLSNEWSNNGNGVNERET